MSKETFTDVLAQKEILQYKFCKRIVKGNITFVFVNLKLIRLRKITQVKTSHLKRKL